MIPRIIHQIWIGDLHPPPLTLMETWKECAKQINAEYILWNEDEIRKRGMVFECKKSIDTIPEINGVADILRWEILLKYGGIFIDADSICIEALIDDFFTPHKLISTSDHTIETIGFATFENEETRKNLVATGTMGFTPNHPLVNDIVEWLKIPSQETLFELKNKKAWITVGPGCITKFLDSGKYKNTIIILPSHFFIPIHYTPETQAYNGHQKVYGHQLWGTGEQQYGKMTEQIPAILLPPVVTGTEIVSILITSYNTPKKWVHECLQSIQKQKGYFMMELVWIDDGSNTHFTNELVDELNWFKRTTRFLIDVKYEKINENVGTRIAIDKGIKLCTNELIIKMDSDDIMFSTRIQKQIDFMKENPQVLCCGGQLIQFQEINGEKIMGQKTNHPLTILKEHCENWSWFMNHPTLCYRKWAVEEVGGYGIGKSLGEDRELEVKLWNYFGNGSICNIPNYLILYRIHKNQLSYGA